MIPPSATGWNPPTPKETEDTPVGHDLWNPIYRHQYILHLQDEDLQKTFTISVSVPPLHALDSPRNDRVHSERRARSETNHVLIALRTIFLRA